MSALESPAQPRRLGGYEVLHALKAGGMGEVLLARRSGAGGFQKLVAIKTIRGEYRENEELRRMFLDEARLLSRLSHPAIAQVHDFGDDGGELYLVMEYVEGVRFRRLAELSPPPAVAAAAMAAVCGGLHAAHELADLAGQPLHVVHRDITPENLMITYGGQIKVLDFGIALMRGRQAPVTELGTIKGKPPYLSPEQLKCEPLDRRTDVFAAGLVLHELLTGEPVFVGESVYAVARAIEHEPVPPPSATVGELPAGLDEAVLRAVERDRERRFPDARAFAEALARVVASAGGPSLEDYAAMALADDHVRHRAWLQSVLATEQVAPTGRPSGIMTAPTREPGATAAGAVERPAPRPSPRASTTELSGVASRRNGARSFVAIALLLAGALAVGVFALSKRGAAPNAAAPAARADAGLVVAAIAPADAGVAAVARDAAPAATSIADAAPPRRIARKKPERRVSPPTDRPPADPAPEDPPPKEPAVPAELGKLTVAAEPYALVRIDGTEVGATPIFGRSIAAGPHEIVLSSPDSGEIRLKRRIVIAPGEHEKVILK